MTNQEFSTEFDVLYNNVTSNQAPGINEYEKSVFLTKAQSQLVNEYFNSRTDGFGGGFDGSQKRQYDFSELIRIENLFDVNSITERVTATDKLDRRSKVYLFPQNYFLAINEIISDDNWQYSILPVNHAEYQRLMLKPYNFPVKRGVWRLITNKKACNFAHVDTNGYDLGDTTVPNEFKLLTTWADNNVSLNITIVFPVYEWSTDDNRDIIDVNSTTIRFHSNIGYGYYCKIIASSSWNADNSKRNIVFKVYVSGDPKDNRLLEIMKDGFKQLKESDYWNNDTTIVNAVKYVDCLAQASAPDNTTKFRGTVDGSTITGGMTLQTKVISLPMIEIIGKFTGNILYQLRYIRTLSPIILDDLTNYGTGLTIGGVQRETECELPEETHQEILERAVTLAKIAWQGGTMTGAAQQQNNNS